MDYIPVSLFDQIELQPCNSNSLELTGNLAGLSVDDNLIIKAIRLLEWEIGQPISLRIHLQKNIPTGAGLGGGSGNAAGTLVVLNRLLHLSLSDHRLKQMAIQLGADVPFFISPQPSLACGIGEQLTPLPDFDPLPLLLVYPGFPISTAEAYRICLISGENAPLHQYTMDEICRLKPEMNDFWGPLTIHYPALEKCRMTLMENKASASGLSGSGSTIFGVFETREIRDRAAASLKNHSSWQIFPCETLASYRYPLDKQSA